jgi:Ca2+-binding RTX toxin-like protein
MPFFIVSGLRQGAWRNLRGTPANDPDLSGTDVSDTIIGLGGADLLRGLDGADCLYGDAGQDTL